MSNQMRDCNRRRREPWMSAGPAKTSTNLLLQTNVLIFPPIHKTTSLIITEIVTGEGSSTENDSPHKATFTPPLHRLSRQCDPAQIISSASWKHLRTKELVLHNWVGRHFFDSAPIQSHCQLYSHPPAGCPQPATCTAAEGGKPEGRCGTARLSQIFS